MEILKNINLGFRFMLELGLVFSLGYAGLHIADNALLKWSAAILLPLGAVIVWGLFIAPKATHVLEQPQRIILELILFGIAVALLLVTGHKAAAIALASAVLINEVLLITWKQ